MTIKKLLCLAMMLGMTNVAYCVDSHSESCNAHCDFVSVLTQLVIAGRDEDMRGDVATALAAYLEDNPQCGNDPVIVNDIVRLVTDKNDAVKAGAAQALGNIGPAAKAAVPALKRALLEAQKKIDSNNSVMLPSLSTADVIRNALDHIEGPVQSTEKK